MKEPASGRRTRSASVVKLEGVPVAVAPWIASDELWDRSSTVRGHGAGSDGAVSG